MNLLYETAVLMKVSLLGNGVNLFTEITRQLKDRQVFEFLEFGHKVGFKIQDSGFKRTWFQDSGFKIQDSRELGFRIQDSRFRIQESYLSARMINTYCGGGITIRELKRQGAGALSGQPMEFCAWG